MHFRAKKQDMKKHPNSKNHLDSSVKSMNSYASEILREINSSHFTLKKRDHAQKFSVKSTL